MRWLLTAIFIHSGFISRMNGMNRIGIAKGSTLGISPKQRLRLETHRMANGSLRAHAETSEAAATSLGIESLNFETSLGANGFKAWWDPTNWHNISIPEATFCQRFSNLDLKNHEKAQLSEMFKTFVGKKTHRKRQKKTFLSWLSAAPADAVASDGWLVRLVWVGCCSLIIAVKTYHFHRLSHRCCKHFCHRVGRQGPQRWPIPVCNKIDWVLVVQQQVYIRSYDNL